MLRSTEEQNKEEHTGFTCPTSDQRKRNPRDPVKGDSQPAALSEAALTAQAQEKHLHWEEMQQGHLHSQVCVGGVTHKTPNDQKKTITHSEKRKSDDFQYDSYALDSPHILKPVNSTMRVIQKRGGERQGSLTELKGMASEEQGTEGCRGLMFPSPLKPAHTMTSM